MQLPVVRGLIDRRILVNYRVEPDVLAACLPPPFRPQLVGGWGMAGICLIRLRAIRAWFLPAWCGVTSEKAAHRIAVEWEEGNATRTGVFIPRRDTSLWLNAWAGGRLFPGVHHQARFEVRETPDELSVALVTCDGGARVAVQGHVARDLPAGSVFPSLAAASEFFQRGALGYSPNRCAGCYDGLELRTEDWRIEPLRVTYVASSYFDDPLRFPSGAAAFDSAFLMRGLEHSWHARPEIRTPARTVAGAVAPRWPCAT
jgi:hypothetical protein